VDRPKHLKCNIKNRAGGVRLLFGLLLLLTPSVAHAYVGPGAGFAFVTSFFLLLSTLLLALLAMLTWPLRLLWRLVRRRRPPAAPRAQRVVILGLDGMDPKRLRRMMDHGQMPNFTRLAQLGGFGDLATTCPAISPVAWSTFATGSDPSHHGIFDFLAPSRKTYRPRLSSTEILPPRRQLRLGPLLLPLSRPRLRLLRRSMSFWSILGRFGIPCHVLRVPITFPPERFDGTLLSAMCVPDLLGTQGSFTYFTSDDDDATGERIGGRVVRVRLHRDRVVTRLPGPPSPLRRDGEPLDLPLSATLDRPRGRVRLRVGSEQVLLEPGRHSDWVTLRFRAFPGVTVHGICRFRLASLDPFRLYVTPINIDPRRPSLPVSHPFVLSVFLGKLIGPFATLGLAEDTWALNEGVLDEEGFLEQLQLYETERERMFFAMLHRLRRGLLTCVFDGTDRVQHMFLRAERGRVPGAHPWARAPEGNPCADAVDQVYRRADALLGRLMSEVDFGDPRNLLLVLSDHGFAPFERGVNLNTWLVRQGYMALQAGHTLPGEHLEGVDWTRTRAYALGLSGIYLNLKGREAQGLVTRDATDPLLLELKQRLEQLEDPEGKGASEGRATIPRPIRRMFITRGMYRGPFLDDAPDLIVGYERGYRASWDTARGMGGAQVVEPNPRHWGGDHCIDPELVPGVLLSSQPLRFDGAAMADIAPTVLELFGVTPPPSMTGKSLLEPRP